MLIFLFDLFKSGKNLFKTLQFIILKLIHNFGKNLPHDLFHYAEPSFIYFFNGTIVIFIENFLYFLFTKLLFQFTQKTFIYLLISLFYELLMSDVDFFNFFVHFIFLFIACTKLGLMFGSQIYNRLFYYFRLFETLLSGINYPNGN